MTTRTRVIRLAVTTNDDWIVGNEEYAPDEGWEEIQTAMMKGINQLWQNQVGFLFNYGKSPTNVSVIEWEDEICPECEGTNLSDDKALCFDCEGGPND